MKLFLIIFAAIIVAAAVIFTGLYAMGRVNQWEMAKRMCYAQISAENDASERQYKQARSEIENASRSVRDLNDEIRVADVGHAAIQDLQESGRRVLELERKVVLILENKPFGIPLTAQEQGDLLAIKTEVSKNVEKH